jgi:hypothetical protein
MGEKNRTDGFIYRAWYFAGWGRKRRLMYFISEPESKSSRVSNFQLLFVIRSADGGQYSHPLSHLSEYLSRTSRIWVSESDLD